MIYIITLSFSTMTSILPTRDKGKGVNISYYNDDFVGSPLINQMFLFQ